MSMKRIQIVLVPCGMQTIIIISEAGLYKLIFKSRKAEAKEFTRWVTHEAQILKLMIDKRIPSNGGNANDFCAYRQNVSHIQAIA